MAGRKNTQDQTISAGGDEDAAKAAAQAATDAAAGENRLPATGDITNPEPTDVMNPASGAFVEPAVLDSVDPSHPAVENNPRRATSAVQNGIDLNDPGNRDPGGDEFVGQGLDRSVYGGKPVVEKPAAEKPADKPVE